MPFNVEAPMVSTYESPRYPAPDWSRDAEVREAWLPGEETVGWLIIQDDKALVWASSVGPDQTAAYAIRGIVEGSIRESLEAKATPREAWDAAVGRAMFRAPVTMSLADLVEELKKAWS